MISNLDTPRASGGTAAGSDYPPHHFVKHLKAGTPPSCTPDDLARWILHADHARSERMGNWMISPEELLQFYRDYLASPEQGRPELRDFLLNSVGTLYNQAPAQSARTPSPLLNLPQASTVTVVPTPPIFRSPAAQEPPQTPLDPARLQQIRHQIAAMDIRSDRIRRALDATVAQEPLYPITDHYMRQLKFQELLNLLGIAHPRMRLNDPWPEQGTAAGYRVGPEGRGAYFAGHPWSGPYSIRDIMGELQRARDPAAAARLFAHLRDALACHDREIVESQATFRALAAHEAGSPQLAPDRLIRALRCAYLRSPEERRLLMHALAGALDVTLETGPRSRDELLGYLDDGFTTIPEPLRELRHALGALQYPEPPDMAQCNELANQCLHCQRGEEADIDGPPIRQKLSRLDGLLNTAEKADLRRFLGRLRETVEFHARPENVVAHCKNMLDLMLDNPDYRRQVLLIAESAINTCPDNVNFGLTRTRLMQRVQLAPTLAGKLEALQTMHLFDVVIQRTYERHGRLANSDLVGIIMQQLSGFRGAGELDDGGINGQMYPVQLSAEDVLDMRTELALARQDPRRFPDYVIEKGWLDDQLDGRYAADLEKIDVQAQAESLQAMQIEDERERALSQENIVNQRAAGRAAALERALARAGCFPDPARPGRYVPA